MKKLLLLLICAMSILNVNAQNNPVYARSAIK